MDGTGQDTARRDREEAEVVEMDQTSEINFMKNVNQWPNWPFQTVRNRQDRQGGFPRCGLLLDVGTLQEPRVEPKVYDLNLFALEGKSKEDILGANKFEFPDFESLTDAGWEID